MILRASTCALVHLLLHHGLVAWCRLGFTFISCKSSCTRPGHREGWLGRYLSLPSLLAFTHRPLPCSGGFWPFGCFCLWFRVSWCHLCSEVGLLSACTLALPRASFAAFPCLLVHSLLRILPGHLLFLALFCTLHTLLWGFWVACLCFAARHPHADGAPCAPVPLARDLLVPCDLRDLPSELLALVWTTPSCICSGTTVLELHLIPTQCPLLLRSCLSLFVLRTVTGAGLLVLFMIWRCSLLSHHQCLFEVGS